MGVSLGSATLENNLVLPCEVDWHGPQDPEIPLSLGINPGETLAHVHQEMWTKMVMITIIGKSRYHGSLHDPIALSPRDCLVGKWQLRQSPSAALR